MHHGEASLKQAPPPQKAGEIVVSFRKLTFLVVWLLLAVLVMQVPAATPFLIIPGLLIIWQAKRGL